MKTIPLTQGKFAVVDDDDFEWLSYFRWRAKRYVRECRVIWYAARSVKINGRVETFFMHREIMGVTDQRLKIDHRNTDGLDNQKRNLRFATVAQNAQNKHKQPGRTSRFKGVYWNKQFSKWMARVKIGSKRHFLGYFHSEESAASAYDTAAKRGFGAFALLNSQVHQ